MVQKQFCTNNVFFFVVCFVFCLYACMLYSVCSLYSVFLQTSNASNPNLAPHQVLCPEGWTDITGECAKFFHEKRTWWDARKTCQDNGGDLLTSSTQPHLKNALHSKWEFCSMFWTSEGKNKTKLKIE